MTVPLGRRPVLAGCAVALAGCSLLPEEPEPIEAEATAPAVLPESAGYATVVAGAPTVETTVRVDLSGDVQLTSRRDVTATVFRRVYEAPGGRRFGLLTAPAVRVVEDPEVIRDPVASLDADRVLELATDRTIGSVDGYEKAESVTPLSTETTREVTTATLDGGDARVVRLRVRAGEDSVTAVAVAPDEVEHPFEDVRREA